MRRLMLGIAVAVTSLLPAMGMADDQQIADYIKGRLQAEQQQGNLRGFNVDMRVEQGTVWFKGHVANRAQEMTILQTAQKAGHLGVVKVVDDIKTQGASPYRAASYPTASQQPQQQPLPSYTMPSHGQQASPYQQQASPYQKASSQEFIGGFDGGYISDGGYIADGGYMSGGGYLSGGDPLPFASAGSSPSAAPIGYSQSAGPTEAPNLPGYAWPGYAASPNYGAVAYPRQHSASAWPYIGPFYPYPQVPLGWRKVSLEWDDGWWMLDFHDK